MSSRNRPRTHHNQDADEERRLWSQIKADGKRIDAMVKANSATIGAEIVEIEHQQAALLDADKPSDPALDERLETLYRENVRISDNVQHIIEGKSDDMNLLDSIKVLQGLRAASEESSSQLAAGARGGSKQRASFGATRRKAGSIGLATDGLDGDESPVTMPSPRVGSSRIAANAKPRGGSVAPVNTANTRETSVKLEDGHDSDVSSSALTPSIASANNNPDTNAIAKSKLALTRGTMVFYRSGTKGRAQVGDGIGILCRITNVIGEGKQRRYEIQDTAPDGDDATASDDGAAENPTPYRASVSNLVPIPTSNARLPHLARGRHVLAQYPDTTTFYRAEVSTPWKARDNGTEKGELVRLRFEGETEESKETEVERRLVLIEK